MHELSIALSLVEAATEEAARHGGRVEAVHLRLGALSGVVKDALLFSWSLACEDTPLAGSTLQIEDVPVTIWCPSCDREQQVAEALDLRCSLCGSLETEVRRGRELQLSALQLS